MLSVRQFRFGFDNLSYLIYGNETAMAVDGVACDEILSFVKDRDIDLLFVANTHNHADHTGGNHSLLGNSNARLLRCRELQDRQSIEIENGKVEVYLTPGHSEDSLCFHVNGTLITGDTLFNGTVGNCFSGNLEGFFHSVKRLMDFPPATVIYAGHDYVQDSMAFARSLEPANGNIDRFMARYDRTHVCSTLADEFKINPFLRFNDAGIVAVLEKRGLSRRTEFERWKSLMTMG